MHWLVMEGTVIRSLLTELFDDAGRLAGVIVGLLSATYISGFLIVNLFLGQFGVVRLELVQTRFVAAGLLFLFIAGVTCLFSLILLVPVLELVEAAEWIWQNPQFKQYLIERNEASDQQTVNAWHGEFFSFVEERLKQLLQQHFGAVKDIRPGGCWEQKGGICAEQAERKRSAIMKLRFVMAVIVLSLAVVLFCLLFYPFESFASTLIVRLLTLSGVGALPATELKPKIELLARLEGISGFLALALIDRARHLHRPIRRAATVLTIVLFLSVQAYSISWFAARLYGELPRSVGGGRPTLVQFLIDRDELPILEELGVPIDPSTMGDMAGKTKIIQLIDETTGGGRATGYTILPCLPTQACRQAIEFDSTMVLGLVYCTSE